MKKTIVCLTFIILFLPGVALSGTIIDYPWRDHAFPFDFQFGNHIDTHQQTRELSNGDLFGFLYITFTGDFTEDGLPIAEHCHEDTPPEECVSGWILRGKPGMATFVFFDGDHPIWLVATRADIPQPGAFAHFHWLGEPETPAGLTIGDEYEGYFIELVAIKKFAFSHAGQIIPVSPGIDIATHVNIVASFPPIE